MPFEWDEAKRQSNIAKHDVDFVRVELIFEGRPTVTHRSPFPHEVRFVTTGKIDDLFYIVIWTQRDEAIRFISARRARREERRAYRSLHGE
jgi:uncharacterized protein